MTESPTIPRARFSHPRALLLISLFALPLLLLHLGNGEATDMMELFNLVPVREAVRDGHWLMPTLNGLPRLEKPPLPVWLPAALATVFHSDALWIVRLPSILAALATCFATYLLAARLTHSWLIGLLSALSLAVMIQFLRHARLASYDIYATCFTTWGLLGLYLLTESSHPRLSSRNDSTPAIDDRRKTIDDLFPILLTGISLGLAILSKGPIPVATICLPFGLWLLLYHRRPKLFFHIFLAAILSVAVFLPWLLAIAHLYPGAWGVWYREILQNSTAQSNNPAQTAADLHRPFYYYLQLPLWVFPLTPTLIAGLILPFLKPNGHPPTPDDSAGERKQTINARLPWILLIAGILLLSCLAEKKIRYALPLFPPAAILCALVFEALLRPSAAPAPDAPAAPSSPSLNPPTKILLAAHSLLFFGAAFAIPLAHLLATSRMQHMLAQWTPHNPKLASALATLPDSLHSALSVFPGLLWLTFSLVLFLLALYLWVEQFSGNFRRATVAFFAAAWLLLLAWTQIYYGSTAFHTNPQRPDAEALAQTAGNHPVYTLQGIYNPWLSLLYFANRPLPQVPPADFQKLLTATTEPLYLLLPDANQDSTDPILQLTRETFAPLEPRLIPVLHVNDGHYPLTLYQAR